MFKENHSSTLLHAHNSGNKRTQRGACTIEEKVQREPSFRLAQLKKRCGKPNLRPTPLKRRCRELEVEEPTPKFAYDKADGADGGKSFF